jgi:uncharacterized protein (DUF4415 family)
MTDVEVARAVASDPDTGPPTDAAFWATARAVPAPLKQPISIRIDKDVLDWFRALGPGWQSRINMILRGYMERHRQAVEAARAAAEREPDERGT